MFIKVHLEVVTEPENPVDKYAVSLQKDGKIVGHLKKRNSGRYAKTFFYFLRSDPYSQCTATVKGKRCNLGDGEGLQVPCSLNVVRQTKYVKILRQELMKIEEV